MILLSITLYKVKLSLMFIKCSFKSIKHQFLPNKRSSCFFLQTSPSHLLVHLITCFHTSHPHTHLSTWSHIQMSHSCVHLSTWSHVSTLHISTWSNVSTLHKFTPSYSLVHLVTGLQTPNSHSQILAGWDDIGAKWVDCQPRDGATMTHKYQLEMPLLIPHFDCNTHST